MMERFEKYTALTLRIGTALVLIWFGINQLTNPYSWIGTLPDFLPKLVLLSPTILIMIDGVVVIVLGLLLALGCYTRIAAAATALHNLAVVLMLGYNDVAVRDLGLTLMALALVFSGGGYLSVDNKIKERRKR